MASYTEINVEGSFLLQICFFFCTFAADIWPVLN